MTAWIFAGLFAAALLKYTYSVIGADIENDEVSDWLFDLKVFDFLILLPVAILGGPITLCLGGAGALVATVVYAFQNGLPDFLGASVYDFRKERE